MKRNMREWADGILRGGSRKAMPIMTYPGLKLINKSIPELIADAEIQFRCMKALTEKYPSAAALTVMDLSVEAQAFGSRIKYSEKETPSVIGSIVSTEEDAKKLKIPGLGEGRMKICLEAARAASLAIADRPVFGGQIGPFSLAGRLMDMTGVMIAMMEEPEIVHIVLDKCIRFLIDYSKAFKQNGANGVVIAEPAAGLLPPEKCDEFSSAYLKRLVDEVQDEGFMVILHNCGNTVRLVPSMLSTGSMGLHFGNAVKMSDILPQVPEGVLAFGNIDPAAVLGGGTPDEVERAVLGLLEEMKPYRNFVLSSGCDIPPSTSLENMDAFFGALAGFNGSRFRHEAFDSCKNI
jgi:uroporphyrinogen decarboxylase